MHTRTCQLVLALTLGLAGSAAMARDQWCPPPPKSSLTTVPAKQGESTPPPSCSPSEYLKLRPICPKSAIGQECVPHWEPPGVDIDLVQCVYDGFYGYNCTIWPQGPGMSYQYTVSSGSVTPQGISLHPGAYVTCPHPRRAINMQITVTSPFGLSSTGWLSLPCQQQQEY